MRTTTRFSEIKPENKKLVDTQDLQALLCVGRQTAVRIDTSANARVQVGKRVLWNVGKVQKYIDEISGE